MGRTVAQRQVRPRAVLANLGGYAEFVPGGKFDFALIDGDHSYRGCFNDSVGVVPYLLPGAYVLYHDANYPIVKDAIDDFHKASGMTDCGLPSVAHTLSTAWTGRTRN